VMRVKVQCDHLRPAVNRIEPTHGKQTVPSAALSLEHFPLPCLVRVRVRSEVNRVRVSKVTIRVRVRLRVGLWFRFGVNVQGGGKFPGGKCPNSNTHTQTDGHTKEDTGELLYCCHNGA